MSDIIYEKKPRLYLEVDIVLFLAVKLTDLSLKILYNLLVLDEFIKIRDEDEYDA